MPVATPTLRQRIEEAPSTAALVRLMNDLDPDDQAGAWRIAAEHFRHVDGPFIAALLRTDEGDQPSCVSAATALLQNRHASRGAIAVVLSMMASELTMTTSVDRARELSHALQQFTAGGQST